MRIPVLSAILSLLLLAACTSDRSNPISDVRARYAPETQHLLIPVGRDTAIACKNGTVLHFCKNSFLTNARTVALDVQEVTNRAEMVALRLDTRTTGGRLLESGGMLSIRAVDPADVRLNPDCPIRVDMPARGFLPEALVFRGHEKGEGLQWENPQPFDNDTLLKQVDEGFQLFCTHCAACHSNALSGALTGPRLGNIHRYRDEDWLIRFTKNSQRFIASGDPLAVAVWNRYKPVLMPDVNLSDDQIRSIYRWIAAESQRLGLDALPGPAETPDSIAASAVYQSTLLSAPFYKFKLDEFEWYNCDAFLGRLPPVSLQVQVKNSPVYDRIEVVLVYENRNMVFDLQQQGGVFRVGADRMAALPQEPVLLMGFGVKGRQLFIGELHSRISGENKLLLDLKPAEQSVIDALFESIQTPAVPDNNWCDYMIIEN